MFFSSYSTSVYSISFTSLFPLLLSFCSLLFSFFFLSFTLILFFSFSLYLSHSFFLPFFLSLSTSVSFFLNFLPLLIFLPLSIFFCFLPSFLALFLSFNPSDMHCTTHSLFLFKCFFLHSPLLFIAPSCSLSTLRVCGGSLTCGVR